MTVFNRSLAEAMRLTRAGRPGDATKLIRAALTSRMPQPHVDAPRDAVPEMMVLPLARAASPAPAGGEGTFTDHAYAGSEGSLRYKLYRPATATAALPLVVMLHGCTQTPDDFARGTRMNRLADEFGLLVAYPAQAQGANANRCWNWFRPGDQQRDRGEPALIAGLTRQIVADHSVDAARIYVAGLSAGGAAAVIMGAAYPDLYAAIGVHSGLAAGAARNLPAALTAMKRGSGAGGGARGKSFVPVITFHGDDDTTVAEINSREIVEQAAAAAGGTLTVRTIQGRGAGVGGRSYTQTIREDAARHALIEQWTIRGGGHAWSGGDKSGSYTDPAGPDASREMLRFFLDHQLIGNPHG